MLPWQRLWLPAKGAYGEPTFDVIGVDLPYNTGIYRSRVRDHGPDRRYVHL
jgi:hypothetical protein